MPRTHRLGPHAILLAGLGALMLLPSGCDQGRSPGMVVTGDGRVLDDNATTAQQLCQERITQAVAGHAGPHWRCYTTIAQLPVWDENRTGDGDWLWEHADVAVHLLGDGQTPPPLSVGDIHDGVVRYMHGRVSHASKELTVTVEIAVDARRFAALAQPQQAGATVVTETVPAPVISGPGAAASAQPAGTAFAPAPAPAVGSPTPPPAAAPGYRIQPGDTWAELSVAFCGGAEHWRRLAEANHWNGLPPVPGAALMMPEPEAASPVAPAPPASSTAAAAGTAGAGSAPAPAPAPAEPVPQLAPGPAPGAPH